MIGAKHNSGGGFGRLAQYLMHGRNGASPDRVAWTATRNLPTTDPEQAAALMQATANHNERVERPVYHLSVSLAPDEHLGRGQLEQVADRLLTDLGLDQHQAVFAAHTDCAHQHIHLLVNRVHAETRRAWKPWLDYAKIEGSLRTQERELGLRIVPGRNAPVQGRDVYLGTRRGRGAFAEQARELAGDSFRSSKSWQELHGTLSGRGLALQPSRSGRGLVVTDGRRYVAASKLDRDASRVRLEKRLGAFEPASPDLQKIQEITRTLDQRGKLYLMRNHWARDRADVRDGLERHAEAQARVAQSSRKLDKMLGSCYRDPAAARGVIEATVRARGWWWTHDLLRDRPAAFGRLKGRALSRERRAVRDYASGPVRDAVGKYLGSVQAERNALDRLREFRRHPEQGIVQAAKHAKAVLGRAIRRLDRLDKAYAPEKVLERQAKAVVERLGWRAVRAVVPGPAVSMLRAAVSVVRGVERGLDRGGGGRCIEL